MELDHAKVLLRLEIAEFAPAPKVRVNNKSESNFLYLTHPLLFKVWMHLSPVRWFLRLLLGSDRDSGISLLLKPPATQLVTSCIHLL